jgi:hypothetical protein
LSARRRARAKRFLKRRALTVLPAVQALAEGIAGYENLVVLSESWN